MPVYYQVLRNSTCLAQGSIETPFQLGRQQQDEADLKPVCIREGKDIRRLIFASITSDRSIPRKAIAVDVLDSELQIHNIHESTDAQLSTGRQIGPGEKVRMKEAILLFADNLRVRLSVSNKILAEPVVPENDMQRSFRLLRSTDGPASSGSQRSLLSLPPNESQGQGALDLVRTALKPFKEIPGTESFYSKIVSSVIDMIDVDRAIVLVEKDGVWEAIASCYHDVAATQLSSADSANRSAAQSTSKKPLKFSQSLVRRVVEVEQTVIVEPNMSSNEFGASILDIDRAVASPIFDDQRKIIAILYADKQLGGSSDRAIGDLEALLLEVLASAASTGLMRQRDEEFRSAAGQFFSPRVLDRLQTNRDLLEGRDAEVSVLFCDIRGFSTVSHRAGPEATIAWINDVLTCLSECILRFDGVVVDYIGDEVMAMFGAPEPQTNHADRAYQAAREMMKTVPTLNERWKDLVLDQFGIGIGVNSGIARVGNTGSRLKFKYGPLGNTVNMGSRLQGVTKQIGVPALMSGSTKKLMTLDVASRRLTSVRVVGIDEPVDLFEIADDTVGQRASLCKRYETALQLFEQYKLAEATGILAGLVQEFPDDKPSHLLLGRSVAGLGETADKFDPVWKLNQK